MTKEKNIEFLLDYVKQQKIIKGEKLPSERELSSLLKISRTTIREVTSILEERRIFIVKRGSGIYLAKSIEEIEYFNRLKNINEDDQIKKQLEAFLMISPIIAGCAAVRADDREIDSLQNCIVKMSRAIISNDPEEMIDTDFEFYNILALMTKNYKLISIMEELNSGNRVFWEYFIKSGEFVSKVIFAGYIEMINAVKQKNRKKAVEQAKENIHNICKLFSDIKNSDYCADMINLFEQ